MHEHVGTVNQDVRLIKIAQIRSATRMKIDKTDGLGKDCMDRSGEDPKKGKPGRSARRLCTPRITKAAKALSMSRSKRVINGG